MAIDLDAIRKKLGQLSGNSSKRNTMWRPQEGEEHTVSLLSFQDNDGQPFKERYFYYNIGNNPGLLAPYQFGKPDPIQELITKLRDDGSKESYELAKKLYPKMRTYAPVIVRGEEDKGVRLWAFGKTVYQSLLNIMLDEDYGDITDPSEGRDVKVSCNKPPVRMWAMTEVRPRGKGTPLSSDTNQAADWVRNIPDLDEMFTLKTYAELEKIVNDWLNGDDGSDDTDEGTTRGGSTTSTSSSSSTNSTDSSFKSLDDAFADLESM
ncbi:MAG: hypothetical protein VXW41_09930 [SAR324 cluster bacterium]|nr:hypothetical protein [SAR324 cluster bacterium]